MNYFTYGCGHLGLDVPPPAHPLEGGAKMTNDSKGTKVTEPSTIVENQKTQLTEEELKKVSVGALQDDELDLATGGVRTYGPIMN